MPIRLVIADDHPVVLNGLESLFKLEPDFAVVARCRDGEETLRAVRRLRPDLLILDIRMPGKDGLAILRQMKQDKLPTRVVLLTAALDDDEAISALRFGVRGVVLKEMAPELLVRCVRKVYAGGQWLEKRSIARALEKMMKREAGATAMAEVLTPREMEVARMVANGLRNRQIAETLSITEGTVKIHLHKVYEKLGVDGRVALSLYGREKGLI